MMKIQILVDNPNSWVVPWARQLNQSIRNLGHDSQLIHEHSKIQKGDILFLLSCEQILKKESRELNQYNVVVHASDLPNGRGWSPTTWQVLEGKNEIPVSMLEAEDKVDSGKIYLKSKVVLEGHELIQEIREKLATVTNHMCLEFVAGKKIGQAQVGEPTFYAKRTSKDSELDPSKSIAEQFDLLRICDNERYPAFFYFRGHKYLITVNKG